MMNADRKKQAFTLVELMVAMAAAAIVILTVAAMLLLALRVWNTNKAYVSLRRDTAFAAEQMARAIRASYTNNVTAATNNLTVSNLSAVFERNPANNVISYSRSNTVTDPFLARNVAVFYTVKITNRVQVTMVMVDTKSRITFTNSTSVYIRN